MGRRHGSGLQREMMGIELLLVGQRFEVGLDGEIDDGGGVVGKILPQRLRVDGGSHSEGSPTADIYTKDGGGLG